MDPVMMPCTYLALGNSAGITPYQLLSAAHLRATASASAGFGARRAETALRTAGAVTRVGDRTPARMSAHSSSHTRSKVWKASTTLCAKVADTMRTSSA
uniref:GH3-13 n=1 Tax=Arundo donax TaxID=35708 RepID=A0A0A9DN49_ARUDO